MVQSPAGWSLAWSRGCCRTARSLGDSMVASLKDKVVLVTGGGSGIGRASALAFAREGAKVVVADISTAGSEETEQMLKERGGDGCFIRADVTKADS